MARQRFSVVVSEHLSPSAIAWLRDRADVSLSSPDQSQFGTLLEKADGLIVRTYTRVDETLLERAPRLRVVGRAGTGLDNIVVTLCRQRGVEVVYTPDANTQAVVEYVLCLMCDALRPRVSIDAPLGAEEWSKFRTVYVGGREMRDLTLGILGMGRIGQRLAYVTQTLTSRVLFNDLLEVPSAMRHGAEPVTADELFAAADVLSIHIDGRESNRAFIGERLLARARPNLVLINTSRGFVVDNLSLASFLKSRPEAVALLDVHDPEPIGRDYPLLQLPNAILYPHLASRTKRAMENMSWVVRDVIAVLEGRLPEHRAP